MSLSFKFVMNMISEKIYGFIGILLLFRKIFITDEHVSEF